MESLELRKEKIRSVIRSTVSDPENTCFVDVWNKLHKEVPIWEDQVEILRTAKEMGKLSPEISNRVIDFFRSNVFPAIAQDRSREKFHSSMTALAEQEDADALIHLFAQHKGISPEVSLARSKEHQGLLLDDNDVKLLAENSNLEFEMFRQADRAPNSFFLYYYDNGDLKWLWGVNDDTTYEDLTHLSKSGSLGETQTFGSPW